MITEFVWDGMGGYNSSGLPKASKLNHSISWCRLQHPGYEYRECTRPKNHDGYHERGSVGGKALARWYTQS